MPPIPRDENYQRLLRGEMTAAEYVAGVRTKIRLEHARFSDRLRARIAELERENERLREALEAIAGCNMVTVGDVVHTARRALRPERGDGQDAD